jgi:hypothetical protein
MLFVDVERIPVVITDIMEAFGKLDFNDKIRLAGGAPRDLLLGAEVSDWDFFIYGGERENPMGHLKLNNILFDHQFYPLPTPKTKALEYEHEKIFDTTTWESKGIKLQTIYSKQMIDDFDISTCQVALDMHGKVYVTREFQNAIDFNVHRVFLRTYKTMYQLVHGLYDHVPRIKAKYGWPVILDNTGVSDEQLKYLINSSKGEF